MQCINACMGEAVSTGFRPVEKMDLIEVFPSFIWIIQAERERERDKVELTALMLLHGYFVTGSRQDQGLQWDNRKKAETD